MSYQEQDPYQPVTGAAAAEWPAAPTTPPTPPTPVLPSIPPQAGSLPWTGTPPGIVNRIGKTRNPWGVWLLNIVTLTIYGYWWYYTVNRELRDFDHQINVQPGVSLCAVLFGGFTIGIALIVSWARTGGRIAQVQRLVGSRDQCSAVVGVLLGIVGFGVVYYQSQINKVWDAYGNPPAGSIRP